jgi:hypothetical protein|tara:strand:- start:18511 stop:18738 length:228 start_codon:yes stop_codon:yes gene_type:complete
VFLGWRIRELLFKSVRTNLQKSGQIEPLQQHTSGPVLPKKGKKQNGMFKLMGHIVQRKCLQRHFLYFHPPLLIDE